MAISQYSATSWGKLSAKTQLPSRDSHVASLLGMTNLIALRCRITAAIAATAQWRSVTALQGWQYLRHKFIGVMLPSLSLRGRPRADAAISTVHSRIVGRSLCEFAGCYRRFPRRFAPRNDNLGECRGTPVPSCGLMSLYRAVTDRRYRRNRFLRFYRHLVRTGSAFPRLPRRFAPRNDNSEVHTILTMACTDRQHCAGRGMPLPHNGVLQSPRGTRKFAAANGGHSP